MRNDEIAYIISQYTPLLDEKEEFETRINWGQTQFFFECVKNNDYSKLHHFKRIRGENNVPPLYFANGQCDLPDDFQKEEYLYYLLDGVQVRINLTNDRMFEMLKTNRLVKTNPKNPIANIQSNYIRLLPTTVHFVVMSYLTSPTPIKYAVTTDQGYPQYDANNSQELLWDVDDQVAIIMLVLKSIGITATKDDIKDKSR